MTANGPHPDSAGGRHTPPGDTSSPSTFDRQKTRSTVVSDRWCLAALLTFTLIVRGTVLWSMRDNLNQDPDAYREIAENLMVYGEFALDDPPAGFSNPERRPTAYRPPLYPVLLSNLPTADGGQLSLTKVAALHLLLGIATVWLTWLTARRVGPASAARAGQPIS